MENYTGRWRVVFQGRDAAWDQRVVISGGSTADGPHSGPVGHSYEVDGEAPWSLQIQHDDGTGWSDSLMRTQPMVEAGANLSQIIESEDVVVGGDQDFNDFVVRVEKVGPMFEVTYRPWAVNAASLEVHPDGVFVGVNGVQYMGVRVTNTWGRSFHDNTLIGISNLGRQVLLSHGMTVLDSWSAEELDSVSQDLSGTGVLIGSLEVGESRTVYFKVDASGARRGKPAVNFHLYRSGGVPDLNNSMRFNERNIFIAEVAYDFTTNEAIAHVPEGTLRLKLNAIMVDRRAMQRVCRELVRSGKTGQSMQDRMQELLGRVTGGYCDQETLAELLALVCQCLGRGTAHAGANCGCDGKQPPVPGMGACKERFLWLPVDFEYAVDTGGFTGQFGPLPFQDPWWKVALLIIAVLAWIVGAVADATGWGRSQPDATIGTVGPSSLANVDAALIELNGSRGIRQSVPDAITGEPNQNAQVALDALIPIDPQVVTLGPTDIGMRVFKSGARTGLTHGVVTSITATINQCRGEFDDVAGNCTPDPSHPNHSMNNQIEIGVDPTFNEGVSNSGDSGSLWLSNDPATRNRVVGLNHSGRRENNTATANPVQDVLNALNIRLMA